MNAPIEPVIAPNKEGQRTKAPAGEVASGTRIADPSDLPVSPELKRRTDWMAMPARLDEIVATAAKLALVER